MFETQLKWNAGCLNSPKRQVEGLVGDPPLDQAQTGILEKKNVQRLPLPLRMICSLFKSSRFIIMAGLLYHSRRMAGQLSPTLFASFGWISLLCSSTQ